MEVKCNYCGKIISGQSEKQIEQLMLLHKLNKHKDKMKITEADSNSIQNQKGGKENE